MISSSSLQGLLQKGDIALVASWARQESFVPGSGDGAIDRHADRQGIWVGRLCGEAIGCIAGVCAHRPAWPQAWVCAKRRFSSFQFTSSHQAAM